MSWVQAPLEDIALDHHGCQVWMDFAFLFALRQGTDVHQSRPCVQDLLVCSSSSDPVQSRSGVLQQVVDPVESGCVDAAARAGAPGREHLSLQKEQSRWCGRRDEGAHQLTPTRSTPATCSPPGVTEYRVMAVRRGV